MKKTIMNLINKWITININIVIWIYTYEVCKNKNKKIKVTYLINAKDVDLLQGGAYLTTFSE